MIYVGLLGVAKKYDKVARKSQTHVSNRLICKKLQILLQFIMK